MTTPTLTLVPTSKPATIWDKSQLGGAQSNLQIAAGHVIRHSTKAQVTGESWDRHMLEIAVRDARAALDEIEALFAAPEPEAA